MYTLADTALIFFAAAIVCLLRCLRLFAACYVRDICLSLAPLLEVTIRLLIRYCFIAAVTDELPMLPRQLGLP